MKTINIDGKVYVLETDIGEQYVLKSVLEEELKQKTPTEFRILSPDSVMMDESNVLGIGAFQLGQAQVTTRIGVEYLEKVIKCLKAMSLRKEGLESVDLAWGQDFPAIIGTRNKKGEISGFIIAPRISVE